MNIAQAIDQSIAVFSPSWGLKRVQKRRVLNRYEAAEPSRNHPKRTDRGSGDAVMKRAGDKLRVYARYLDENYDIPHGALDILVNNIVGTGIRYEPIVRNKSGELHDELNKQILELHKDWSVRPEVTFEYPLGFAERLKCRTWLRDGEVLTVYQQGWHPTIDHGTRVPFSLELLEPDQLPMGYNEANIIQGVEKNAWRRPIAYHILKAHPGDHNTFANSTKRVPANYVNHLKLLYRIGQTRGVSILATVLRRLDDLQDYESSERLAARINAKLVAYIKKGEASMYGEVAGKREQIDDGMIFYDMEPGAEVGMIDSNRPNSGLDSFRNTNLKSASAGMSVGNSSLSKNYNGTYAAQRQELVEQGGNYSVLRNYFCERSSKPDYRRFIAIAELSGLINVDDSVDRHTLFDVVCSGPPMPWIDPLKDAQANIALWRNGFKPLSQIIREYSTENPMDVIAQIKRDVKMLQDDEALAQFLVALFSGKNK